MGNNCVQRAEGFKDDEYRVHMELKNPSLENMNNKAKKEYIQEYKQRFLVRYHRMTIFRSIRTINVCLRKARRKHKIKRRMMPMKF